MPTADTVANRFIDQMKPRSLKSDVVIGEQARERQRQQNAQQREHRQPTDGGVSLAVSVTVKIGNDPCRRWDKTGKTRMRCSGKAPDHPENQQSHYQHPKASMPIDQRASVFGCDISPPGRQEKATSGKAATANPKPG